MLVTFDVVLAVDFLHLLNDVLAVFVQVDQTAILTENDACFDGLMCEQLLVLLVAVHLIEPDTVEHAGRMLVGPRDAIDSVGR